MWRDGRGYDNGEECKIMGEGGRFCWVGNVCQQSASDSMTVEVRVVRVHTVVTVLL